MPECTNINIRSKKATVNKAEGAIWQSQQSQSTKHKYNLRAREAQNLSERIYGSFMSFII